MKDGRVPLIFTVLLALLGGGTYAARLQTAAEKKAGGGAGIEGTWGATSAAGSARPTAVELLRAALAPVSVPLRLPVKVVVATVPDPESGLDYLYDRTLEAIRRAARAERYTLVASSLPWKPPAGDRNPATPLRRDAGDTAPGALLFTRQAEQAGYLLVLVVGETPLAGVDRQALVAALADAEAILRLSTDATAKLPMLGPYFSGSTETLRQAIVEYAQLRDASAGTLDLRILSGSATRLLNRKRLIIEEVPGLHTDFSATMQPDEALRDVLFEFLQSRGVTPDQVAMLTEDTAYGQTFSGKSGEPFPVLTIPFPLHISEIRTAHATQKERAGTQPSNQPTDLDAQALTPPLADARPDIVPALSPLSAVSDELILNQILGVIGRHHVRFVGLAATDARDKLFLANQIATRCPGVTLFTFESEILFTHPKYISFFRGTLVASTYPLIAHNQFWTSGFARHAGADRAGEAASQLLQFANGGAEGVYNATLALLGAGAPLLEYGLPLPENEHTSRPPVWISVIGNQSIWPVSVSAEPAKYVRQRYTLTASATRRVKPGSSAGPEAEARSGIDPHLFHHSRVAKVCFVLLSWLVACVSVLYLVADRVERPKNLGVLWGLFRVKEGNTSRQKRCFIFLSFGMLTVLYLLLAGFYSIPFRLAEESEPLSGRWKGIFVAACAVLVVTALLISGWKALRQDFFTARGLLRHWLSKKSPEGAGFLPGGAMGEVKDAFPVAVVFTGVLLYLLYIVVRCLTPVDSDLILRYERATNPISGVSPLVPFALLAAGCYWNSITQLRRLTLVERRDIPLPFQVHASSQEHDLAEAELSIAESLISLWPTVVASVVTLAFLGHSLFRLLGKVFTRLDGPYFGRLFEWGFLLLFLSVTLAAIRYLLIWSRLRSWLERLGAHPIAAAFDRVPGAYRRIVGVQSLGRWRRVSELQIPAEYTRLLARDWPAVERQLTTALGLTEKEVSRLAHLADEPRLQTMPGILPGPSGLLPIIKEGAGAVLPVLERAWARRSLSVVTAPETTGAEKPARSSFADLGPAQAMEWLHAAEELVALHIVLFMNYVFVHLWNLIACYAAGATLLFIAFVSYPFQPARLVLNSIFLLILSLAFVSVSTFIQMDRDGVLSRLSRTVPGRITWDIGFIMKVLIYGVLPAASLIAARVPAVQASAAGWLDSLSRVLK